MLEQNEQDIAQVTALQSLYEQNTSQCTETLVWDIYVSRYSYDGVEQASKLSVDNLIQSFVDDIGECVSIQDTVFMYTGGNEKGFKVTFINYPRFNHSKLERSIRAYNLAVTLREFCNQERVSVVGPDKTYMIDKTNTLMET